MAILPTIKGWIRGLFKKEHREEFLSGVSATPDFPDPASLITWILMSYRHQVDTAACFTLEHIQGPLVRLTYDTSVVITIRYGPPFSPAGRLKAIGLPLPPGFTLTEWRRHSHFTLTGPKPPPAELATFVDLVFRKLYRAEKTYVLAAWTELRSTPKAPPPTAQKLMPAGRG